MTDRSPSNPLQPNSPESNPPESNKQSIGSRETIAPSGLDLNPKNSGPFPSLPVLFGRFEVRKHLGKGAMGTVYLAFDPELNNPEINNQVAIKIPLLQTSDDSTLLERFCREAQATGAMNHPNICKLYEVGEINGTHYISMEYIDGRPLADYIGQDQQPQLPRQVAGIIRKLAEGLAHAHERGFIHRDLKPTNVMIATNGQPKIMDFGLARRFGVTGDIRLTQSNTIVGSPAYMSPEQARGENDTLTPASDIYSLGTLFFELLTCELPFKGPLAVVLGMVALNRVPKPSTIHSDVDPRLEALCLKMLEKKVESRPKSMTEVANALTEWLCPAASKSNTVKALVEEPVALTPKKTAAPRADKTDGIEAQKRRVTDLLNQHEYGAAISLLEKMTNLRDARFESLIAWAKPTLKEVRATEQQRRDSSAPSCATAEQLLKHYDYTGAVELLTAVPSAYRSFELRDLLRKATERHDECEHLQRSIEEAIRDGDKDTLPGLVKGLLKLKPNNKAIKQLAAEVKELGSAKVIARRKGQRQIFDPAGRVVEPQHIALSIVLVVGLFVGVSLMVRNYLATSQPPKPVLTSSPVQPTPIPPEPVQSAANSELLKQAPVDVVAFEKKLFKVFPEQLTWHEAKRKCQEMGGQLAQVNSQAENDFLVKLAVERKLAAVWLGATDEVEERTWLWSSGAGLAFNNFTNGQPDRSRSGKRYLVMMLKDQVGSWCNQASQSDDWSPGFICEWNAPAVANKPAIQLPPVAGSQGWTELFNGRDLTGWVRADNHLPAAWKVANGYMEVVPGTGPIMTAKTFPLDFKLYVEFWIPKEANKSGQARGNSGIFLLGRHEIQILDVFENPLPPPAITGLGALYNAVPSQGVTVRPPETWQTFNITFHAPRIDAVVKRNEPGRLTVIHDGKVIIDNAAVTENFSPGSLNTDYGQPGPLGLQDHRSPVRFRNIRIQELPDVMGTSPIAPKNGPAPVVLPESQKNTATIPADAVVFQKKRFKLFTEQLTWHDAKKECQQLGGRLAEVRSKEENDFITKMAVNQTVVGVWLGATDDVQEKRWLWSDGSEVTFKNWSAVGAQPNGTAANDEDYLLMMVKNSSVTKQSIPAGEWFDQPDSSKESGIGYICEWDR